MFPLLSTKFTPYTEVHHHVHKSFLPNLSQLNPVHGSHFTSSKFTSIFSSHLRLGLPNCLFPSCFPAKSLCTPLFSPIRATYPAHRILLDFITGAIFGAEYRKRGSSLCSLLPSPVRSALLVPSTFLTTLFSDTLSKGTQDKDKIDTSAYCYKGEAWHLPEWPIESSMFSTSHFSSCHPSKVGGGVEMNELGRGFLLPLH